MVLTVNSESMGKKTVPGEGGFGEEGERGRFASGSSIVVLMELSFVEKNG